MYGMNGWYDWEPVFFFERARYTAALQKQALPIYEGISSGKETLQISYKSTACDIRKALRKCSGNSAFSKNSGSPGVKISKPAAPVWGPIGTTWN